MYDERSCVGCGALLQSDRQDEPGYVPRSATEKEQNLCRRCFRIRHYGEFSRVNISPDDYSREVSRVIDNPGLVLYTLDVFDLMGSLVPGLHRYIVGSRVVVVVNKTDVLPKEVNIESAKDWVWETIEDTGLIVDDVVFVSAATGQGIDELTALVKAYHKPLVYVVGMANVGKSTLLNRILQPYGGQASFTVSRMPGTTLGLSAVELPLSKTATVTLVDTPGLIHGDRIIDKLCPACLKQAVPSRRLRPRVFQLNPKQSLWIGGFARFDFVTGERQSIVCYVSNDMPIHRCKLERADEIGSEHMDDILQVPCTECRQKFGDLVSFDITVSRLKTSTSKSSHEIWVGKSGGDFVIPGLGFITLLGQRLQGKLWVRAGIEVSTRPRLIGDLSRTNA